jgi:hypothetical protein
MKVRRRQLYEWLLDSMADFFIAVWKGDLTKIILLAAIAIIWVLTLWVRWAMFRRRARQLGLPLDGSIPADDWHPPSSEEVSKILNKSPSR